MKYKELYVCKKCIHYIQHYTKVQGSCFRVYCGHCIYPKVKHRLPYTKACKYFEERDTF